MHRIGQYKIGLTEVGMQPLCDLLGTVEDPLADFREYTEVVGNDLYGQPIEAGLPVAAWSWNRPMSQTDFNRLVDLFTDAAGARLYIRTRNNVGGGAPTYSTYSALMARPTGTYNAGEIEGVTVNFGALILIP